MAIGLGLLVLVPAFSVQAATPGATVPNLDVERGACQASPAQQAQIAVGEAVRSTDAARAIVASALDAGDPQATWQLMNAASDAVAAAERDAAAAVSALQDRADDAPRAAAAARAEAEWTAEVLARHAVDTARSRLAQAAAFIASLETPAVPEDAADDAQRDVATALQGAMEEAAQATRMADALVNAAPRTVALFLSDAQAALAEAAARAERDVEQAPDYAEAKAAAAARLAANEIAEAQRAVAAAAADASDMAQRAADDAAQAPDNAERQVRAAGAQAERRANEELRSVKQAVENAQVAVAAAADAGAAIAENPEAPLAALIDGAQADVDSAYALVRTIDDAIYGDLRSIEAQAENAAVALTDDAEGAIMANARDATLTGPVIVWTNINHGEGSCLDADTLDGLSSEKLLFAVDQEAAIRAAEDAAIRGTLEAARAALEAALGNEAEARGAGDGDLLAALDAARAAIEASVAQEQAARQAADDALADEIANERDARAAGDDALGAAVTAESNARTNAVAALRLSVEDETQARKDADFALAQSLDDEEAARAAADNALAASLADERSARAAADDALAASLADEESARAAADDALAASLADEESARAAADDALAASLADEESARAAADDALAASLADEESARAAADNALATSIADLDEATGDAHDALGARLAVVEADEDADTLDGLDSTKFVRTDVGSTMQESLTVKKDAMAHRFLVSENNHEEWRIDYDGDKRGVNFAEAGQADYRFFLADGGNVGIGLPDPQHRLDVDGFIRGKRTISQQVYIAEGDSEKFQFDYWGNAAHLAAIGIGARMTWKEGGNVGIGTTNPVHRLDVAGSIAGIETKGRNLDILEGNDLKFRFDYRSGGLDLLGAGVHNRVRVTDDGYVGIGTENPTAKLEVAGVVKVQAADFVLGTGDGRPVGTKAGQRALVHDWGDRLVLNYHGDFEGGVRVDSALRATGPITANSFVTTGDVAEPTLAAAGLEPGMVAVMDGFTPDGKLRIKASTAANEQTAVGIVSTNPSLTLAGLATDTPRAVTGIVPVKVHGPVAAGDLLTTSGVAGHAEACGQADGCVGSVIGKALEAWTGVGAGEVRAIVTLG